MRRAALVLTIFVCLRAQSVLAGTVTVAWDPNTEPDIAGYLLSYGTASGQYTTTLDVGDVTSYLFSEPNPSVRYYLAVRAYTTGGAISAYSNEVFTTPSSPSLTVTGISSNKMSPQPPGTSILFTAIASGGTPPYQFKWWINNGSSWSVGQQWSTSNTFTWTPTVAGSGYSIRVWARNAGSTADAAANPAAILSTSFAITAAATTNLAPTVSAGANKTITLPTAATLAGSASDDGKPKPPGTLSLSWTKTSGPGTVVFSAPHSATTSATFSAAGTYVLRLTASDGALTRNDEVTVAVNPASSTSNLAPTVSAGPNKAITLPSAATLAGSASDDGKPKPPGTLSLSWTKTSGPGTVVFSAPHSATTSATFSAAGTYVLRLTASDGALTRNDEVTVAVNPASSTSNLAPTVSAGANKAITLPTAATLAGSASDDGKPKPPGTLSLSWTKTSGPGTVVFSAPHSATTSATFSAAGTYVLRLTASDGALTRNDEVTVAVNPASSTSNLAPTVSAGPNKAITLPSAATLAGSASDDGKPKPPGTLSLSWTKTSGPGTVVFSAPHSATTSATFSAAGTYVLRLTASDGALTRNDEVTVAVNPASSTSNLAPTVSAGADKTITLPTAATLAGTASDDGKPVPPGTLSLSWTELTGPGKVVFSKPHSATTSATFSAAGTYLLRLTASDGALTRNDEVTVTVR